MEEENMEDSKDASHAIIALHPHENSAVVAVGSFLRIFDLRTNCSVDLKCADGGSHNDSIRSITFDREGKLFASAGDDKLVKIWDAESWKCLRTINSEKKVTAISFSRDGRIIIFADKFGAVWVSTTRDENAGSEIDKGQLLLAHCCSIITGLEVSSCGRFVATADRDYKIRVSVFPQEPLKGAYEIQSFCLGHKSFVSCISFLDAEAKELLVSGGGDGTVRLWNYISGELLDTFDVQTVEGLRNDADTGDNHIPTIAALNVMSEGLVIAAAIERYCGIIFLGCQAETRKLTLLQNVDFPDRFIPGCISFGSSSNLWMIMGASQVERSDEKQSTESNATATGVKDSAVTCLRVMKVYRTESSKEIKANILEEAFVPGGANMLQTLQGDNSDVEAAKVATEAANTALKKLLLKREYSTELREIRKKVRNDKKTKQQQKN